MACRFPEQEQEEEHDQLVEGVANLGLNGNEAVVSFHSFLEASCMINLSECFQLRRLVEQEVGCGQLKPFTK